MSFYKFTGTTTRDCLQQLRQTLGTDALIVSTRSTPQGVEVVGTRASDLETLESVYAGSPKSGSSSYKKEEVKNLAKSFSGNLASATQPVESKLLSQQHDSYPSSVNLSSTAVDMARRNAAPPTSSIKNNATKSQVNKRTDAARFDTAMSNKPTEPSLHGREYKTDFTAHMNSVPTKKMDIQNPVNTQLNSQVASIMAEVKSLASSSAKITESVLPPILDEVRAMRSWFETQMKTLTWRDATQRNPLRRKLWQELADAGFSPWLARSIIERLPDDFSEEQSNHWLRSGLTHNLSVVNERSEIAEQGGIYALVGPTGVGKTTTTAKIAARCVVKHGAKSLGLITTDQYRIGAVDQLRTFGRILGVEVYTARGAQDLETMLMCMGKRHLVLIDTVGMGQRDQRIAEQLSCLELPKIKRLLVIPASSHAEQVEDIVQAYRGPGLSGVIFSKVDEAVRIGGVVDAAIRHKLAVHYVASGQRVPEDLHPANGAWLIHRAMKQMGSSLFNLHEQELDWSATSPALTSAPSRSLQGVNHASV